METAINHDYINSYAEAYTNRIVDRYFSENSIIDGENILSITEFRQINLFVVKNIMVKWQVEAKKIRSPFFNYNSPEVQNALQDFMNVLSKNISIEQKVFTPLLKIYALAVAVSKDADNDIGNVPLLCAMGGAITIVGGLAYPKPRCCKSIRNNCPFLKRNLALPVARSNPSPPSGLAKVTAGAPYPNAYPLLC